MAPMIQISWKETQIFPDWVAIFHFHYENFLIKNGSEFWKQSDFGMLWKKGENHHHKHLGIANSTGTNFLLGW